MCFAPSQSYRQNVTTPQLWLCFMFLMHGTHPHVFTNKNYKTTHISFHYLRQWWYLQTQRTWIYPREQSSRQYSWNTARFQDSLITRKNINHAGILTRRTQRMASAAPTIEAYGTMNRSKSMLRPLSILPFIIGRPRLQSWKSSTWVILQKTWKYSE